MNFWFDRTVSGRLSKIVAEYDVENRYLEHVDSSPRGGVPTDAEILSRLQSDSFEPLVVVTLAVDPGWRASVTAALTMGLGCRFIVLSSAWGSKTFHEQAWNILRLWPYVVGRLAATDDQIVLVPFRIKRRRGEV